MRYACDACRLRKVKCNALLSNGRAEVTTSCQFCASIGIACRVTPRQRQRAKTGRKDNNTSTSSSASKRRRTRDLVDERHPPRVTGKDDTLRINDDAPPPPSARLFGVPGLTRDALDSCIDTFFSTVGAVFRLFDSQQAFSRRVRVHLYYSAGLDVPADLSDTANNPANRLLILAVACRGSHFSPHAELADSLYAQCCNLLSKEETLRTGYLDAIEAILLLSELTVQPRHLTPTTLDPLGKGTAVDIALHHGLNIPTPASSTDFERRRGVFMSVWAHDAIRSASAHTSHRITDDDMGWPMPPNPTNYPYLCLTLVAREIGDCLLSPRAVGLGASEAAVKLCLDSVHQFRFNTKVNLGTLFSAVSGNASETIPCNGTTPLLPIEQLFLLSNHNWLYLVMWVAVQDAVERHPHCLSAQLVSEVERAVMTACEDMAALAKLSTAHNLHVTGPKSIRNHMAAYSLFLVRSFTATPTPPVDVLLQYFGLAESLNAGVRAAAFYPDSMTLAETLRVALYRASRVELKDAARVAERGLDALPPDEGAVRTFEALSAIPAEVPLDGPADGLTSAYSAVGNPGTGHGDIDQPYAQTDTSLSDSTSVNRTHTISRLQPPDHHKDLTGARDSEGTGFELSSGSSKPVSERASQSPESIDWHDLMGTLKDCGFEMPLGMLGV